MTYSERNAKAIATLHPVVAEIATAFESEADRRGEDFLFTEGGRVSARQKALYNQPWDKKDNDGDGLIDESDERVTNAKSGESLHEYGCALDFVPVTSDGHVAYGDIQGFTRIAKLAKEFGFEWGGDWPKKYRDYPHLQYTGGYPLSAFKSGKAQELLQAPETGLEPSWLSFASLSLPERIKRIQKALLRATGARLKSLQRALARLIG